MEKASWKKARITFEIEKETSNYIKGSIFLKTKLLSGKKYSFYFQKGVVISKHFVIFVETEVICIRKLLLKKEGFLLNRDCYFRGYLVFKEN